MQKNIPENKTFYKDVLKDRTIVIKSIEDFDTARSCFNRGLSVTLDIPLELVKKARLADGLKESKHIEVLNHDIKFLNCLSDFNLKYIDVESSIQLENLKTSYYYVINNYDELLKVQKVEEVIKQTKDSKYEETLTEVKPTLNKNVDHETNHNDYIMTHDNKYLGESENQAITFEPYSKEIWHYYTTISKEKEIYKQAEKWGLFLRELMDENLEYYKNFSEEQITEIIDENMKKLLSSNLTDIEDFEFQKVFEILKENWKYGYLLTIWQETKIKEKVKTIKI